MSRKRSRSSSSSSSASSSNHSSRSSSRSSRSSDSSHSSRSSKKSDRSHSGSTSGGSSDSRSRESSRSSRASRDSRSVSRERRHRSRSSPSFNARRRGSKSPFNPKATKIYIGRLSRNVNKDHVNEIFCNYGVIKSVELPADFTHSFLSRGFAYVEYDKPEEAEKAIKYMDGGQIDGQVINVSIAIGPRPKAPKSFKRKGRTGWKGGRSPPRHMRRRSPRRRRSPSPYRRPRRLISRSRSISPRKRRGSSRD